MRFFFGETQNFRKKISLKFQDDFVKFFFGYRVDVGEKKHGVEGVKKGVKKVKRKGDTGRNERKKIGTQT